jgi:hypothetical protein
MAGIAEPPGFVVPAAGCPEIIRRIPCIDASYSRPAVHSYNSIRENIEVLVIFTASG